jgi:hypothetical protein
MLLAINNDKILNCQYLFIIDAWLILLDNFGFLRYHEQWLYVILVVMGFGCEIFFCCAAQGISPSSTYSYEKGSLIFRLNCTSVVPRHVNRAGTWFFF